MAITIIISITIMIIISIITIIINTIIIIWSIIMTITESKLDTSFRTTRFLIDGYSKPFRFDRNRNVVGVFSQDFSQVSNCLDGFSSTYDRFLLVRNVNAEDSKETLFNFLEKHNAANTVKDKTCFKSLDNSSYIDLFITNRPLPLFPQAYQIFIKWMLLP